MSLLFASDTIDLLYWQINNRNIDRFFNKYHICFLLIRFYNKIFL